MVILILLNPFEYRPSHDPTWQAQLVNFPPEFAAIPCKPLFYDLALYHVAMPR